MFTNKKTILFITRDQITVTVVNVKKKTVESSIYQKNWDSSNLTSLMEEIKKKIDRKVVRVLVSDSLCYQLEINLEKDVTNEKDFITAEIEKRIPEHLEKEDWDYKIITKEKDKKVAVVIALVNSFWGNLNKAINFSQIKVEAIESETSARQRNEDPVIGIALKKDMMGADRETLNLTPKEMLDGDCEEKELYAKLAKRSNLISIIFGLILGLAALCSAYYFLVLNKVDLFWK
ncbi:MAG: hypothetical protein COU65_01900 [Candidatus Pacebacteria bacterium CG10_big_fil_rev_8_21_14_0_10_42_12]|nr:hypothetical protein [Candidatus Parcubacteria bacterium]NCS66766.1 hypothetical protein [Candidatus Peregrinibacteria bacterium]PIR62717.1 MAG: hypothetical protein COU65_01900 [Candidatus Pacebacteria bacterium CG10_big_fil_rev_8_21_14_0_10_42_12]